MYLRDGCYDQLAIQVFLESELGHNLKNGANNTQKTCKASSTDQFGMMAAWEICSPLSLTTAGSSHEKGTA